MPQHWCAHKHLILLIQALHLETLPEEWLCCALLQAVRPGAVKLGLHKGEGYYSRQDVQELHTRERWEREGRQVGIICAQVFPDHLWKSKSIKPIQMSARTPPD
jgi:hypothetical protein